MLKWIDALKIVGPIVLSTIPATAPFAPFILKGIEVAEEMAAPGAVKKESAKDIVALGVGVLNQVKGTEVVNVEAAQQIAHDAIDQVVKATNAFHKSVTAAPTDSTH